MSALWAAKNHLKCCQKCSKEFPPDSEINGNHQCTPYCKNCDEDHSPLDPICPARVYADEHHNQGQDRPRRPPEADPHAGGQTSKNQQTPQGPGQEPESAEEE
ncbi:hypothetical protein HPB47_009592 [Ixodes persulcatus]|uniref:Uncharacterized protein n=1 Tax=Ixodes persulcatus TaxID=34615 RepID=A0AC60P1H0_IXOPE|nr:hypothetical protein HPB47_009592 [Ixodes persulcatus]